MCIANVCRESQNGGERMVLLQLARPQVPNRHAHEPSHRRRVLEGDWQGPRCGDAPAADSTGGHEEDAGLLPGPRPQGREDQLDHARVSSRGRRQPSASSRQQGMLQLPPPLTHALELCSLYLHFRCHVAYSSLGWH